jgi:hypothetical protein
MKGTGLGIVVRIGLQMALGPDLGTLVTALVSLVLADLRIKELIR